MSDKVEEAAIIVDEFWYPVCHMMKQIHNDPFPSQKAARADKRYSITVAGRSFAMQQGREINRGIQQEGNYSRYSLVPPISIKEIVAGVQVSRALSAEEAEIGDDGDEMPRANAIRLGGARTESPSRPHANHAYALDVPPAPGLPGQGARLKEASKESDEGEKLPYQLMPALNDAQYEALKADIQERGVQVAIEFDEVGNVLDGHHRLQACQELGITEYPSVIKRFDSEEAKRLHVRRVNALRRHLTKEQLDEQILAMRLEGNSYRAIGDALGISHVTAINALSTGKNLPVASLPDRILGKDGKERPATMPRSSIFIPTAPTEQDFAAARQEPEAARLDKPLQGKSPTLEALQSSESNEWYTPAKYIEAARQVMGGIDLDPASCELANKTVQAGTIYAIEDNGLTKEWVGRVFLNPPYGREGQDSNQALWTAKLLAERKTGRIEQAVLLVNAVTDRSWFQPLWDFPICFTDHRIRFYGPTGEGGSPVVGSAFVYFGPSPSLFYLAFAQFGVIATRLAL